MNTPVAHILLVEDDPNDAFFLKRALHKARPDISLHAVTDGEQAIEYLNGHSVYADRGAHPLPSFIFLDLKLPYLSGFDVLEYMSHHPGLTGIPVFILTSSTEERDRKRALELGAREYLVKPPTPEMLLKLLGPAPAETELLAPRMP